MISDVTKNQKLLFDGFIRIEILNNLNQNSDQKDVVNLCEKYHSIDIESQYDSCNEMAILWKLIPINIASLSSGSLEYTLNFCANFLKQKEFFLGYNIIKCLISQSNSHQEWYLCHHFMAALLIRWSSQSNQDMTTEIRDEFEKAKAWYSMYHFDVDSESYIQNVHNIERQFSQNFDSDFMVGCARCYLHLSNYEMADRFYVEALELEADNADYSREYAKFLCRDYGELEQARTYFDKAIELQSDQYMEYYDLANFIRDYVNDYDEAEEYYQKCIELEWNALTSNYIANGDYGYLLYLVHEYDAAKKHIELQIEYDDNYGKKNEWTQLYYWIVNNVLENHEIARNALSKAVEFVETSIECTNAINNLKILKQNDVLRFMYYDKFETMLHNKFN